MKGLEDMPADFREVAAGLTMTGARNRWQCNTNRINRWYRLTGIVPLRGKTAPLPVPEDFVERAPTRTLYQLVNDYGTHAQAVRRWAKVTGVQPHPRTRAEPKPKPVKPPAQRKRCTPKRGVMQLHSWATGNQNRDMSLVGQAADYLRTVGYSGVYHSNERGGFDAKGKFWRAGNVVLTPDELLERARSKGWSPGSWQEIAA